MQGALGPIVKVTYFLLILACSLLHPARISNAVILLSFSTHIPYLTLYNTLTCISLTDIVLTCLKLNKVQTTLKLLSFVNAYNSALDLKYVDIFDDFVRFLK